MNKRSVTRVLSTLPGFRKHGAFYIGTCNREVVSGYALDAPPGGMYIWRFVLPAYDKVSFLHMSLGKRIAEFGRNQIGVSAAEVRKLVKTDWQSFANVRDCQTLLAYMERECTGDYCQWVTYLTYVRTGHLESASRLESQWQLSQIFPRVQLVAENLKAVQEARLRSGWAGVQDLLIDWSECTAAKFCQKGDRLRELSGAAISMVAKLIHGRAVSQGRRMQ